MYVVIPTLVVFLLALILLFPESVQNVMMSRIASPARPRPSRLGMRMVPTVGLFVFGFAMLQAWDRALHRSAFHVHDPLQLRFLQFGAAAFLAVGIFGCLWPLQFMQRMVPALRGKTTLDGPNSSRTALVGKCFGVLCLLASVHLFRQSLP
jgi:hypothetical protein